MCDEFHATAANSSEITMKQRGNGGDSVFILDLKISHAHHIILKRAMLKYPHAETFSVAVVYIHDDGKRIQ